MDFLLMIKERLKIGVTNFSYHNKNSQSIKKKDNRHSHICLNVLMFHNSPYNLLMVFQMNLQEVKSIRKIA